MISQIKLIEAISKALSKYGPKEITVRQMKAVISAANIVLESLNIQDTIAIPGMGLSAWRASDDTGTSSLYMASVIWGGSNHYSAPSDPSDFGRCYRLIRAVPGTKESLCLLSEKSEYWRLLVEHWGELEKLYEFQLSNDTAHNKNKKYPCYDKMQELQDMARKTEEAAKTTHNSASTTAQNLDGRRRRPGKHGRCNVGDVELMVRAK